MEEAFRFKVPSTFYIVGPSGCGKTCFTKSLLGSLGRIVCKPSPYYSSLPRGVARWTPGHERRWCTISRKESCHFPIGKMVPKGGSLVLDNLMVESGEDKESLMGCFPTCPTLWALPSWWRHMNPARFLIAWKFVEPFLDLENNKIHRCPNNSLLSSLLLIGYCPYKRALLLVTSSKSPLNEKVSRLSTYMLYWWAASFPYFWSNTTIK